MTHKEILAGEERLRSGKSVLDVGCHAGFSALAAMRRGPRYGHRSPSSLSSSSVSKTRVATAWRPPLARLGKRLAKVCSTAIVSPPAG
jgi:hypothetical protein